MKNIYNNAGMGHLLLTLILLLFSGVVPAQMGIGTANPAASAQLDVYSTSKGLLPPRLSQAQRDAIPNPAAGLMIWCRDCGITGEAQVFNGIAWNNMLGGPAQKTLPYQITIGSQRWMTRNLSVVTYRNGDPIPQVQDSAQWVNLTTGAWCYYNNDPAMGAIFGKLYNWYALTDPRGLAPAGWHIPLDYWSGGEWKTLLNRFPSGEEAGMQLRAPVLWSSPGTNSTGFTALPGGYRDVDGKFKGLGTVSIWWGRLSDYMYNYQYIIGGSMTDQRFNTEMIAEISPVEEPDTGNWIIGPLPKLGAFYVRCIRD